jgi:hypothetical protein
MSDESFESWRQGWTVIDEAESRRFHPLDDELRGYGGPEARARVLQNLRLLMTAADKGAFLESTEGRLKNGYLSVLFPPRGGQGPTWYGFSVAQVATLSDEEFVAWRRRFLRWVETHTPGQSRVRLFGTATDEEFEQLYRDSKAKHGRHDTGRAIKRFFARTGIRLEYPRYAEERILAVVASTKPESAGARSGLQPGETVIAVEGNSVREWFDLPYLIGAYRPDSILRVQVLTKTGAHAVRYLRIEPSES